MNGRQFEGDALTQIAMPVGGLGAGCISFNGHGGLQDFAIRNFPATTALPDSHDTTDSAFAVLHVRGDQPVTRLIEGPLPAGKIYDQGLKAQGYRLGGHEGMPRFRHCSFTAEYPFGRVALADQKVPLAVTITAFNPFIPHDDVNSGLPCAILEYTFRNPTGTAVDFDFSYHLSHLAEGKMRNGSRNAPLDDFGVQFTNSDDTAAESFGSAALCVIGHRPKVKAMWIRGAWFDAISAIWREVSSGRFSENIGQGAEHASGRNGGSLLVQHRLEPGEQVTLPIVIAWHFPNINQSYGGIDTTQQTEHGHSTPAMRPWKPFYAGQWNDAAAVARYVRDHYASLRSRTAAFRDALASATVPAEVLDAVSSNLAILKSPTVLRQENGNVWAWEGCFTAAGCCHGSCTHVWNYAQAMPHLFPQLERTLREQELQRSMSDIGHVDFRSALPDGPTPHTFHAAADGQLGGIMKLYRDWQISGDGQWLARLYPLARKSLEFCVSKWDPDQHGALIEPHHNTYDIEFWGPDGMCTSIYCGALSAAARMATAVGETKDADRYAALADRSARYMKELLFNGDYFEQRIEWETTHDDSFRKMIAGVDERSDELSKLCKAEGPRYQYGTGCLSDGVIGAWMAQIYGLDTPLSRDQVRRHLAAVFSNNFKSDLFEHVCLQRPGYAVGDEPGLLLCTWPRGGKPTLPFVYSDEVWTGIEYQVASHLIEEGLVDEGLQIVRAVRSRYDGRVRNPFNEYECGSFYARAMSSFALLNSLSGVRHSAVTKTLTFRPKSSARPYTAFISAANAFGRLTLSTTHITITLDEGDLKIDRIVLPDGEITLEASNSIVRPNGPLVFSLNRDNQMHH